jgi:hypothetical protein
MNFFFPLEHAVDMPNIRTKSELTADYCIGGAVFGV